jgi:hypothetical protein
MKRSHRFMCVAVAAVLVSREAHGEIYHLKSPSTLETEKGSILQLPPGYFMDEPTWNERDREMRRLQDQETILSAQNKSLRESVDGFPWLPVVVTAVVGLIGGGVAVWQLQ